MAGATVSPPFFLPLVVRALVYTANVAKSKEIREFIKKSKSILSSPLQKPQTDLANFLAIDSSFEYSCSIVNSIENKTQKILQNDFIPNDDVKLLGRINSELEGTRLQDCRRPAKGQCQGVC